MGEEKKEIKKGNWVKLGDNATFTSASGKVVTFDFSKMSNEVFGYYGKKQWLSDSGASAKAESEKIEMMNLTYKDAIDLGVQLSPEGRVGIIGKARTKAPRTQDALVLPKMSTYTDEQVEALIQTLAMGLVVLSDAVRDALEIRFLQIMEAKEVKTKGKKQH